MLLKVVYSDYSNNTEVFLFTKGKKHLFSDIICFELFGIENVVESCL